jgi:hypothetical protein
MNLQVDSLMIAAMSANGLMVLKLIGILGCLAMAPLGLWLYRNQRRWFGRCADTPSETSGGLYYGQAQAWLIYLGLVHLFLWLALGF